MRELSGLLVGVEARLGGVKAHVAARPGLEKVLDVPIVRSKADKKGRPHRLVRVLRHSWRRGVGQRSVAVRTQQPVQLRPDRVVSHGVVVQFIGMVEKRYYQAE